MIDKEIIFTFSYDNWPLAATIEIIASKLVSNSDFIWIDWTGKLNKKYEYCVASKIHISQTKKRIKKSNLIKDLSELSPNSTFCYQNNYKTISNYDYEIDEIAEEVAYTELISIVRESKPVKDSYAASIDTYKDIYKKTYASAKNFLEYAKPSKIYLYNGRFLQERAVWEASKNLGIGVNFFEKFNPNWVDRYFVFEEPTHSPRYRSQIMESYFDNLADRNSDRVVELAEKWFKDRIDGKTQNFTKLQRNSLGLAHLKPYFVFFHSSEDELITSELVSKNWGDQISALNSLVEVMNISKRFNLIIRLHPNLLHKSRLEIETWTSLVEKISRDNKWVTVVNSESAINSYKLVNDSLGVITVGSTIGVEAAFLGKKSILLGTAFHEYMGITLNPSNKLELEKMLKNNLTDAEVFSINKNAQKYAIFHSLGGNQMTFVNHKRGSKGVKYTFKRFEVKYSKIVLLLIKIFKILKNSRFKRT